MSDAVFPLRFACIAIRSAARAENQLPRTFLHPHLFLAGILRGQEYGGFFRACQSNYASRDSADALWRE